jgi:hypothetical protein
MRHLKKSNPKKVYHFFTSMQDSIYSIKLNKIRYLSPKEATEAGREEYLSVGNIQLKSKICTKINIFLSMISLSRYQELLLAKLQRVPQKCWPHINRKKLYHNI